MRSLIIIACFVLDKGLPCPDCGGYNQKPDGSFYCPSTCPASGD